MNLPGKSLRYLLILLFLISIFNYPYSASGEPGEDIKLNRSETLIISGSSTCDNISLSDEATLILKNADLRVNGIIRMSGYARLFVENSKLKLQPPEINDSTIVIHIIDYAMIRVTDGSTVEFDPQPNPTNISYMLMEDNSEFFLIDSIFRGDLPSIINQSIEVASVTAGVYLLSGSAAWYMINSDIKGTVSLDQDDNLNGRWFWVSLHQRALLNIDNSDLELLGMSVSYTLLKPVSGSLTIKDSNILGGKVDVEVATQSKMEDSTFASQVRIMDSTMVEISGCTFEKDVFIGTTLSMGEGDYNPETSVSISQSTFDTILRCVGNSTTMIFESTFYNLYSGFNSTIDVTNSTILQYLSVRHQSKTQILNSHINSILMDSTVSLISNLCNNIDSITFYGTSNHKLGQEISFSQLSIQNIIIHPNIDNLISFKEVQIEKIRFYNNFSATFELINTTLGTLSPSESGENVTLTFIPVGSQTPDLEAQNKNLTIHIFNRLSVLVQLNSNVLDTEVEVTDKFGQKLKEKTQSGFVSFDLHYKSIHKEEIDITEDYEIFTWYLSLSETKSLQLTESKTIIFDFIDLNPPDIYEIKIGPSDWNLGKDITVKVKTSDVGVDSIGSTYLFYRIDGGEWNEIEMFKIDDNTYEAIIPKQSQSGTITYYISSWDKAQNEGKTDQKKLVVGSQEDLIYSSGIFILVIFIAFLIVRKIATKRKIKNYANKFEFRKK